MPNLEVRTPDGRTELRKLSRRNPIVIGRNPISDIHVDDESVAAIHCRVSWKGTSFEVAAVSGDGVDVNGVLVQKKTLRSGDVIRVGDLDVVMLNGSGEVKKAAAVGAAGGRTSAPAPLEDEDLDEPADLAADDWEALSAGEIEMPVVEPSRPIKNKRAAERAASPPESDESADEPVLLDDATAESAKPAAEAKSAEAKPSKGWLTSKRAKRPGEQDILTSPLVLGFGGLALALLLAAGAIWLLIGREGADRLYNAAVADRQAGRYTQAIGGFEQFLLEYPTDSRVMDAKYALGYTRIERYAGGSAPEFDKALKAFDEFVRENRDSSDFDKQKEPMRKLAQQIASGASAAAIRTGDRKLLAPAAAGQKLYDRYAPADRSADAVKADLSKQYASAEAAVRKREYFDAAAAKIEAAIAKKDFVTAFEARYDLLTRYPDLRNDRRVRTLLTATLKAEQDLVRPIEPPGKVATATETAAIQGGVLMPIGHTQARAGEVSDGRIIHTIGRDALFGLDAVTGRPIWRTPIGLDTPFFPVEVNASVPALLAFDGTRDELVLLNRDNGSTIWRTTVGARASGAPLISQGQIDLATDEGHLERFDLESGRPLAAVSFPQSVVGPPVLNGERLIVFGERATAYTLDFRTLAIRTASFVGQAAGALESPPQGLGRLVLIFDNDQQKSALVRAFAVDGENGSIRQVAAERIDGHVREPAVARGNVLFVASSFERIWAFSVSDDAGQPPLTRLKGTQIPEAQDVPTFLVPGPDGMLWAAGSALRKLRLGASGLEILPGTLAPGRHTQPPQQSGESLFVARSLPSAPAVYVSQADREAMTGSWRTVLGAGVTGLALKDADASLVTSAGQALALRSDDIAKGGFFDTRPLPQWDENAPQPLQGNATGEAESLVWRDGTPPVCWLIRAGDLPGPPKTLPAVPQCGPVRLEGGFVLPLPGRLEWLPDSVGAKVGPFLLPVAGEGAQQPAWTSLIAIDGERLLAMDDRGTLRLVRLRQEPVPNLGETASVTLDKPLVLPPAAAGERIAIADGESVRLLDPAGLRPVAEAKFDKPVTGGPWSAGEIVFAEIGSRQLVALSGDSLQETWRTDVGGPLAGGPLQRDGAWTVALQSGTVLKLGGDGKERGRFESWTPQTRLIAVGDQVTAVGLDGTLHAVKDDATEPAASPNGAKEAPQ
jgi:outer membrane protein assembly factor BamB